MEKYSSQSSPETPANEPARRHNIEKLTGWLMNLSPEEQQRGRSAERKSEPQATKTERYFERRQEVKDDAQTVQQRGMIAVGEVLADKTLSQQQAPLDVDANERTPQSQQVRQEEHQAYVAPRTRPGLTAKQAIQVGVAVGVGVGLLVLLWLRVR